MDNDDTPRAAGESIRQFLHDHTEKLIILACVLVFILLGGLDKHLAQMKMSYRELIGLGLAGVLFTVPVYLAVYSYFNVALYLPEHNSWSRRVPFAVIVLFLVPTWILAVGATLTGEFNSVLPILFVGHFLVTLFWAPIRLVCWAVGGR
jgi:hypothetical protein